MERRGLWSGLRKISRTSLMPLSSCARRPRSSAAKAAAAAGIWHKQEARKAPKQMPRLRQLASYCGRGKPQYKSPPATRRDSVNGPNGMFKKILIPVDLTEVEVAKPAISAAVELALSSQSLMRFIAV